MRWDAQGMGWDGKGIRNGQCSGMPPPADASSRIHRRQNTAGGMVLHGGFCLQLCTVPRHLTLINNSVFVVDFIVIYVLLVPQEDLDEELGVPLDLPDGLRAPPPNTDKA